MQGKVAAVHAHVPELAARLAQLQAEVAPLVERHQTLSGSLPWKEQLVCSLTSAVRIPGYQERFRSPAILTLQESPDGH